MSSEWPQLQIHTLDPQAEVLAQSLGTSAIVAQLALNRGISADEAETMLEPVPDLSWPEPALTQDLRRCFVELSASGAAIAIFGDYDADGLSGTSVLSVFLRGAGFEVTPVLPTRSQGYGLNQDSIQQLADAGHALLITVDCGISNASEIAFARSLGLQVVITDHHGLPDTLPEAEFILHPAVLQIPELSNLSGAGMAWWLSAVLHPAFAGSPSPQQLLDLAVLGTLADMTPLRGLNFALAKRGLEAMRQTQRPGLLALSTLKNLNLSQLTEDDLTFRMIPMLNAAGRIDSPQPALDLLLSQERQQADKLALQLQEMNTHRQQLCQDVLAEALSILANSPEQPVIVLAQANWLHGVLGITCSQLVERFHKPVVMMAIEGQHAKASVRSPKGYHVLEALQACDDLLVRYGGHEMAGGFTVETGKIPAFSQRFEQACLSQQSAVQKKLNIDLELDPARLSLELVRQIRELAPFGMGNPMPLFLSRKVRLEDLKSDRKSHSHFFARIPKGPRLKGWQMWDDQFYQAQYFDLVYTLEQTVWREQTQLELTLQALRPHQPETELQPELQLAAIQPVAELKPLKPLKPLSLAKDSLQDSLQARHLGPEHEAPLFLAGWFYDGSDYWLVPQTRWSVPIDWQDRRDQLQPSFETGQVLYCSDHPASAEIRRAQPGQFHSVLINQPPPNWAELSASFVKGYILAPLTPAQPASFQDLWPMLAFLQEQDLGLQDARDLARRFGLMLRQAELCLKSLSDLGLLAYDRERYRIQYKNQLYDLRQSSAFMRAHELWQQHTRLAMLWPKVSLEHLTHELARVNQV